MISDETEVPAYVLPDPLIFADGSRVTDAAQWRARRREILELFAAHVYGETPDIRIENEAALLEADTPALGGAATRRQTRLTWRAARGAIEVDLLSYRPATSSEPSPAIIVPNFRGNHSVSPEAGVCASERARREHSDGSSERGARAHQFPLESIVARGYQLITFYYGDVAPDLDDLGGGAHPLFPRGAAGRASREWGAVGAWAWGASRVLDHVSMDPHVDPSRAIVAGHSRLGKAALWAAAQDERFAAVFANDSGCTGAAISRRRIGETVSAINTLFPHWFCPDYHAYAEREQELPVDQHQLVAAIAPRPVYVASAAEDLWADPRGEYLGAAGASEVYRLLGHEGLTISDWPPVDATSTGRIGYHLRPGGHDMLAEDWARFLDFVGCALRQ